MPFTTETIKALSGKLDSANVKERTQSGRRLFYIEGWHAIAEANRIFGFDAWNRETVDIRLVQERERPIGSGGAAGWGVTYIARVRVTVGSIIREGVGSGHGIDRDLGLAHESAIKEAETDAMKRALMTFGNPFGLALYDKDQANVGINPPEPTAPKAPPPPDSPALATITALLKECASVDAVNDWVDKNSAAFGKLTDADYIILESRIIRWREHIAKKGTSA
jgi:DNA recombination protein Rad52